LLYRVRFPMFADLSDEIFFQLRVVVIRKHMYRVN
jgi:hypothetical protein